VGGGGAPAATPGTLYRAAVWRRRPRELLIEWRRLFELIYDALGPLRRADYPHAHYIREIRRQIWRALVS